MDPTFKLDKTKARDMMVKPNPKDPNSYRPPNKICDNLAQFGVPTAASTNYWVLTTWQTFKNKQGEFDYEHKYHVSTRKRLTQKFNCFHPGLAVVDECRYTKNIGKGPWGIIKRCKEARPHIRF